MEYAIFNGKIIKKTEATIPIDDKGYFFDFSVYSSIKIIQGRIFFIRYHIDRLFESAKMINLGHSFSKAQIFKFIYQLIEKNKTKDALLRIVLIGDTENNINAKLYIFQVTNLTYYPKAFYKKGVKLITYNGERRVPGAKTKDMLLSFLAFKEARLNDAMDALLVDGDKNIREGTQSNFFAIRDNHLITPPDNKVLGGITKKIVLKTASAFFEIKKENIPLSDINQYDEFFITSTTKNIMPVNQINNTMFQYNFPKTKLIQRLFREYYKNKILNTK